MELLGEFRTNLPRMYLYRRVDARRRDGVFYRFAIIAAPQ